MAKHLERKTNKVLFILRLIFIIMITISIIYIIKWYSDNVENKELEQKVSEAVKVETIKNEETTEIKYIINFRKLKEINDETVAWLKVAGTDVEYPIVQAKDNNYYLRRNFNKEYNLAGWIFADYKNKLDGTDKNIVIYGHNRRDDSMFGTLRNILNEDWYKNSDNYIIDFITEKETLKYEVFSVYQIESEDYYIKTHFANGEFSEFIEVLKNRSIKDFNVEISSEDSILTLSTCANNNEERIVLHAKLYTNIKEK